MLDDLYLYRAEAEPAQEPSPVHPRSPAPPPELPPCPGEVVMLLDDNSPSKGTRRRLPRRVLSSVVTSCQNQLFKRQGRARALTRLLLSLPPAGLLCVLASGFWHHTDYSFSATTEAWYKQATADMEGLGVAWYMVGLLGLRLMPATVMFFLMFLYTRYEPHKSGSSSSEQRLLSTVLEWGWRELISPQPWQWQIGWAALVSLVEQLTFRVLFAYIAMTFLHILRCNPTLCGEPTHGSLQRDGACVGECGWVGFGGGWGLCYIEGGSHISMLIVMILY